MAGPGQVPGGGRVPIISTQASPAAAGTANQDGRHLLTRPMTAKQIANASVSWANSSWARMTANAAAAANSALRAVSADINGRECRAERWVGPVIVGGITPKDNPSRGQR